MLLEERSQGFLAPVEHDARNGEQDDEDADGTGLTVGNDANGPENPEEIAEDKEPQRLRQAVAAVGQGAKDGEGDGKSGQTDTEKGPPPEYCRAHVPSP